MADFFSIFFTEETFCLRIIDTVNVAYTTMIVAPNGSYTLVTGDKIVKGNITLDINKISDLKAYEVLTVVGIQSNNIFNTVNIECK